jgi:hypothetical protein
MHDVPTNTVALSANGTNIDAHASKGNEPSANHLILAFGRP